MPLFTGSAHRGSRTYYWNHFGHWVVSHVRWIPAQPDLGRLERKIGMIRLDPLVGGMLVVKMGNLQGTV